MTVVRDENLDGHAVLTVLPDRGDLVLDSIPDQLHLWFPHVIRLRRFSRSKILKYLGVDWRGDDAAANFVFLTIVSRLCLGLCGKLS
jgi:hypothetical protein